LSVCEIVEATPYGSLASVLLIGELRPDTFFPFSKPYELVNIGLGLLKSAFALRSVISMESLLDEHFGFISFSGSPYIVMLGYGST